MKLFIASDIHGSAHYTKLMLELYKETKAERLLLLGDILYHGPRNDLPAEYNPKLVIEMLNNIKDEKYSASEETVKLRWTRWYLGSRAWLIIA